MGNNIVEFTPAGEGVFADNLSSPFGLAFNSAGNLFEADFGSGNIYEFTPGGTQSTFATLPANGPAQIAFDSAGNLFVSDQYDNSIVEITPEGQTNTFATGLNEPAGLAFDKAGNLFEADFGSGNIYEFTNNNGTLSSNLLIFATISIVGPDGLVFDSSGNLFVSNGSEHGIIEISPNGTQTTFISSLGFANGLAFQPLPELQSIATNGTFQVTVTMPSPYYSTIVQASGDLVNWTNICTNTPPFTFTDSMEAPLRFYRTVLDTNSF